MNVEDIIGVRVRVFFFLGWKSGEVERQEVEKKIDDCFNIKASLL